MVPLLLKQRSQDCIHSGKAVGPQLTASLLPVTILRVSTYFIRTIWCSVESSEGISHPLGTGFTYAGSLSPSRCYFLLHCPSPPKAIGTDFALDYSNLPAQ